MPRMPAVRRDERVQPTLRRRIAVRARRRPREPEPLDLRTPSGRRRLPY
ncbi:hypothetical protein KDK95_31520 [Actinospica sp. MGRD01-02]|uniref:Uncharacterized protein n=1 Tax=Actinospica acidithermotolerans TaxID=2828514 RepID=A0A941IPX9_9ACTN|nr:hypothetical protein [Actinospica acidithermotolerans]MBR7830876.1 hypothetical protein [Actinospica acidithermotolerans]